MSLTRKRKFSTQGLETIRANARRSRGPVTREGRARSAAAHLRHGYYSQSAEVALAALGENPAEFKRRLESLVATHQPADALEMGLVVQMLRAQWRMERFHRMAECLALGHLEKVRKHKEMGEALFLAPLFAKVERLKGLFAATCLYPDSVVGLKEMQVFEKCRGDLPAQKAAEVLQLLLRLRKPGAREDLGPAAKRLDPDGAIPAAEGEERKAARRELVSVLAGVIEPLEKRLLGEAPDQAQAQIERDQILAEAQPQVALLNRGEESSLRQLWRSTNLLFKIQRNAKKQRDVKNAG